MIIDETYYKRYVINNLCIDMNISKLFYCQLYTIVRRYESVVN